MIVARLDPHSGAVIDYMDWRDATPLPDTIRAATAQEIAALTPAPIPIPPTPREWLERLSAAKQATISAAALASPAILLWLLKASGVPVIDVTLQETKDGVAALVLAGVLTTDDAAILLAA